MVKVRSNEGYALAVVITAVVLLMSALVIILQYINSISVSIRTTSQMEAAYNTATSGLTEGLGRIKAGELNDDSFNGSGVLMNDNTYRYLVKSNPMYVSLSSNGTAKRGAITHLLNEKVYIPTPSVESDYKPIQVSAGNFGTCVLASKKVYCWGDNRVGQINGIPPGDKLVPIDPLNGVHSEARGLDIDNVSLGYASCATSSGRLYCWGATKFHIMYPSETPKLVNTGDITGRWVEKVATGWKHICAIAEGKVYCWGDYLSGDSASLGRISPPISEAESLTPRAVRTDTGLAGKTVTDVSMEPNDTSSNTCVVADGQVYCWGGDRVLNGQAGFGFFGDNSKPQLIGPGSPLQGKMVEKVSLGNEAACALSEGRVYCWGSNVRLIKRPTTAQHIPFDVSAGTVLDDKTVTDIAVGWNTACAVAGGKVYCWGAIGPDGSLHGAFDKTFDVAHMAGPGNALENKQIDAVDIGASHICATGKGWVYCWGSHGNGATGMGISNVGSSTRPASVSSAGDMKPGISASTYPTLAVSANTCSVSGKNAYCWGENIDGSVGSGNTGIRYRPVHIAGDYGLAQLRGEVSHVVTSSTSNPAFGCGLVDRTAYCWGNNSQLSLGDGTNINRTTPVAVAAGAGDILQGKRLVGISAGRAHVCTTSGGRVYCWGAAGTLGNGSNSASSKPVAVATDSGSPLADKYVINIAAGGDNTCAAAASGVYCWGKNQKLETGAPGVGNVQTRPYKIPDSRLGGSASNIIAVSDGLSCVVSVDSNVYCWGVKRRLGNGSSDSAPTNIPVNISAGGLLSGKKVTNLAASSTHACAIADDKVYCWGNNTNGQLGDGTYNESFRPVEVKTTGTSLHGQIVKNVAVGEHRTCVSTDNAIYCWGKNSGSFGSDNPSNSATPIQTYGYPRTERAVRY